MWQPLGYQGVGHDLEIEQQQPAMEWGRGWTFRPRRTHSQASLLPHPAPCPSESSWLPGASPLCPLLPPFLPRCLECEAFPHGLIRNHKCGYFPKSHPPLSSFPCPFSRKSFLIPHVYFHINGLINSSVLDCSTSTGKVFKSTASAVQSLKQGD